MLTVLTDDAVHTFSQALAVPTVHTWLAVLTHDAVHTFTSVLTDFTVRTLSPL